MGMTTHQNKPSLIYYSRDPFTIIHNTPILLLIFQQLSFAIDSTCSIIQISLSSKQGRPSCLLNQIYDAHDTNVDT
jgi:hypothetical protein